MQAFGLRREGGIEGSPRGIDVGAVVTGWSGIGGPGGLQGDDALAGLAEICEEICFVLDLLRIELVALLGKTVKLEVLDIDRKMQNLVFGEGGKSYDKLTMEVTAALDGEKEVKYEVVGWFDISRFFGNY